MTAINLLRDRHVVHFYTDGIVTASKAPNYLASKIYTVPHLPMAIASRGLMWAPWMFSTMFYQAFAGFDELVAGIEDAFPAMHEHFLGKFSEPQDRSTELIFAGWSTARQQCEAYFIRAGDPVEGHDPPFRLISPPLTVVGPPPSRWPTFNGSHDEYMLDLMEIQRADYPGHIGGFCQLTTLTQDSITQRILRRWPG